MTPEMINQIFQILLNIISILSAIGATFVINWIKNKTSTEKLQQIQERIYIIQEVALEAVRYAEQQGIDIGVKGNEKMKIATEFLSERLAKEKINISPEEIHGFIKSALRSIKDTWGNEWAK